MTQPRPTHEVFRLKPSEASYDKFVPATSVQVDQHIDQPIEELNVPSVDRLDELRREDDAYLESVAKSERHDAIEELEREKQEGELFRRERAAVKRRVNVAGAVRGRVDEPLIGSLGLGSMIKKRRVVKKSGPKNDEKSGTSSEEAKHERVQTSSHTTEGHMQGGVEKEAQHVELVSGYSSSSADEEQQIAESRDAASEGTKQSSVGD